MRILLITDGVYPIVIGGMQKHSYYVAKFLTQKDIQVKLIHCNGEGTDKADHEIKEFADFKGVNISFNRYQFPSLGKFPGHYIRENKKYSTQIYNDLKDQLNEYDLIYCKGFTAWQFIKEAKKGKVNIPIISNLHGYEMFQIAPSKRVKLEHYLMRGISKYISLNSDYVFSYGGKITTLIKKLGTPDNKILECNTGIENTWLREEVPVVNQSTTRFVFIGRNERRKGIFELSQAIKELIKTQIGPFEFHFIGDIETQHQLDFDEVIYHGKLIGDKKIKEVLYTCDVLVCPSYSEGMPNVIAEGMASGLAIIGTDVGAISAQITNNGWLLPNATVPAIKKALLLALNTPKKELVQMKNNSIENIKANFLWEKVIERKIDCFQYTINHYKK